MNQLLTYFSCLSLLGLSLSPVVQLPLLAEELNLTEAQLMAQSLPNSFEDYGKQCLQRVNREGLRGQVAQDICKCVITKFRSRYSLAQFRDLIQKSKTNKTAARNLSEVGEACLEEVLYEE